MEDLKIKVGQKWKTRGGEIVRIVLDEKDDQPFKTSEGTWHFTNGRMWEDMDIEDHRDLVEKIG